MWGQHLILDMGDCDREAIRNPKTIRSFAADLVAAIGMKAYGDPILEHFAAHDPAVAGYTLVQLIETSNITAHFAEQFGDVYLDVISCKSFSEEQALAVCQEYFAPTHIKRTSLERSANHRPVTDAA